MTSPSALLSSSSSSSPQLSQRRKTALRALKSYDEWDIESILSWRSPTCVQEILPKSLGRLPMDNTAYRAYFSAIMPYFRDFKTQINTIIEDASEDKIAIWATSTATTDLGPYSNEYMLIFYFDEKGERVERFLEFVDSANSKENLGKLRVYIGEREREKEQEGKGNEEK